MNGLRADAMRFQRKPRYEGFTWTDRKKKAHSRRPDREQQRIERDYPLFAGGDGFQPLPALSFEEEGAQRAARGQALEQTLRDLDAKTWRECRRAYFACPADVRAAIRAQWLAWTGPLNPGNFSYVLRKNNGELAALDARWKAERAALRASITAQVTAQADLI